VKHYKNIDAPTTVMDLILVDEIGEKIAKSVLEMNEENKIIIDRLKIMVYNLKLWKQNPNATDKLAGKTFVVSGVFNSSLEMN
jgi:DNA ligase (NAD+)